MAFSGTFNGTVTQSGTDTNTNFSGLLAISGFTSQQEGIYTVVNMGTTLLNVTGTLSFNTGTTITGFYALRWSSSAAATKNYLKVQSGASITIGTDKNALLYPELSPCLIHDGADGNYFGFAGADTNQANDGAGSDLAFLYVRTGGAFTMYGFGAKWPYGSAAAPGGAITLKSTTYVASRCYFYGSVNATDTRFNLRVGSDTGSAILPLNNTHVYTNCLFINASPFYAVSTATTDAQTITISNLPSIPSSIALIGGGRTTGTGNTFILQDLALGSDYSLSTYAADNNTRKIVHRFQENVSLGISNDSGAAIENALVTISGKSGSTTYTATSNVSGVATANVLLRQFSKQAGLGSETDEFYSINNNNTDLFSVNIRSYLHLFAQLPNQILKGQSGISVVWTLFADSGITETNTTTVGAYSGISRSSNTYTLSGILTLSQIYDWFKLEWRNTAGLQLPLIDGTVARFGSANITFSGSTASPAATAKFTQFSTTGTITLGTASSYTEIASVSGTVINVDACGAALDLSNASNSFADGTIFRITNGGSITITVANSTLASQLEADKNQVSGTITFQAAPIFYIATGLVNGTSLYLAHQQSFVVASAAVNTGPDTITLGNDSNSQPPAFATGSPYTNVKIQATAGATLPTTSPQIVDGGRYYATISAGAITLFVKESDIAATPITISTTGTNASGSIFTLIAETQLTNTTISGGSGASVVLTLADGDRVIRKAIYWDNPGGIATATPLYIQEFLWSATAGINDPVVVNPAIELDLVHEEIIASTSIQLRGKIKDASGTVVTSMTAANDGSTLDASSSGPYSFGLEGGGGKLQVNAADSDGLSLWQDAYIWGVWLSSTPPGIRLINSNTARAISSNYFIFANFELDNISSTRLNMVGGYAEAEDGSSLVADTQTGSGGINPNALSPQALLVFETGTSGLTAGEAQDLADLASTLQTTGVFSTAALANAPSGGGGGLTAQQVRDALTLAPTAGSPAAGSVDADLDTLVARNNPLDAAGTRSAVGLGSANLDTQLGAIDTVVDAILVDTDATIPAQITDRTLAAANYFDPATDTVANVTTVDIVTNKTGYSLSDGAITPAKIQDGAFTSAKFASGAFDAVWTAATRTLTSIADSSGVTTLLSRIGSALTITGGKVTVGTNDDKTGYSLTTPPLDSTATQAAAAAALNAYDPPTRAELTSDVGTVTTAIAGLNNLSTAQVNAEVDAALADYDGPTKAELDSAVAGLATSSALATVDGVVDAILEDTGTTIPALIADVPTVAEFEARTIPAADYFVVSDYTAPSNSDIAAIKAKTDNLPSDPADQSAVEGAITAATSGLATTASISALNNLSAAQVNAEVDAALLDVGLTTTVTGRIDAAISSRLDTAGYTAPSNADITAIKAKTDNLPSDPADQSAVEAAITAAQSAILAGGFTSGDRNILIAAEAAAKSVASGRHKIDYAASTATQYNADGTVRTVFDLKDSTGNPATSGASAVERIPQ